MSSYGSRDYGRGNSPEPPRKRVRGDSPAYMELYGPSQSTAVRSRNLNEMYTTNEEQINTSGNPNSYCTQIVPYVHPLTKFKLHFDITKFKINLKDIDFDQFKSHVDCDRYFFSSARECFQREIDRDKNEKLEVIEYRSDFTISQFVKSLLTLLKNKSIVVEYNDILGTNKSGRLPILAPNQTNCNSKKLLVSNSFKTCIITCNNIQNSCHSSLLNFNLHCLSATVFNSKDVRLDCFKSGTDVQQVCRVHSQSTEQYQLFNKIIQFYRNCININLQHSSGNNVNIIEKFNIKETQPKFKNAQDGCSSLSTKNVNNSKIVKPSKKLSKLLKQKLTAYANSKGTTRNSIIHEFLMLNNRNKYIYNLSKKRGKIDKESIDRDNEQLKKSIRDDLKVILFGKPIKCSPFHRDELITVLIRDESQPLGIIHNENVNILEDFLLDLLMKDLENPDFQKISLHGDIFINGNYKLKCLDEFSYNWLDTSLKSSNSPWYGAQIRPLRSYKDLIKTFISVKDTDLSTFEISVKLQRFNPFLKTNKWCMVHSHIINGEHFIIFGIDDESWTELVHHGFNISYGFEKVRFSQKLDIPYDITKLLFGKPSLTSPYNRRSHSEKFRGFIRDENQPLGKIHEKNVKTLENALLELYVTTFDSPDTQDISFYGKGLDKYENYEIKCINEYSYNWLGTAVNSLNNLWIGAKISLMRTYNNLIKTSVIIPDGFITPFSVTQILQESNPLLKTNRWKLIHCHKTKNKKQFLLFGIDLDSWNVLKDQSFRSLYGTKIVAFTREDTTNSKTKVPQNESSQKQDSVNLSSTENVQKDKLNNTNVIKQVYKKLNKNDSETHKVNGNKSSVQQESTDSSSTQKLCDKNVDEVRLKLFGKPTQSSPFHKKSDIIDVLIRDESQPIGKINTENVKILEDALLEMFKKALNSQGNQQVSILAQGLIRDNYKVKCLNESSFKWLETAVSSLNKLWNGADLKLLRSYHELPAIIVTVSDIYLTPFEITKLFQLSNPLLKTNKWFLFQSHINKVQHSIIFGIDECSLKVLNRQSFNIYYGANVIRALRLASALPRNGQVSIKKIHNNINKSKTIVNEDIKNQSQVVVKETPGKSSESPLKINNLSNQSDINAPRQELANYTTPDGSTIRVTKPLTNADINVLIKDESHILGRINLENVNILEHVLRELVTKIKHTSNTQNVLLNFEGLVKYNYRIKCADEYSYNWLCSKVNSVTTLWPGADLKLLRLCDGTPTIKLSTRDIYLSPYDVTKKLQESNQLLKVNKWCLVENHVENLKQTIVFVIDKDSLLELRRLSFRLNYGTERIAVILQKIEYKGNMLNVKVIISPSCSNNINNPSSIQNTPGNPAAIQNSLEYSTSIKSIKNVDDLKLLIFGELSPSSPFYNDSGDFIRVQIRDESQLLGRINEENSKIFEDKLLELVMNKLKTQENQKVLLHVALKNYNYRIRCLDEYSYNWLETTVSSLNSLWVGADIKLLRSYDSLQRITFRNSELDAFQAAKKLQESNQLLKINKWYLVFTKVKHNIMVFGIDQDSFNELQRQDFSPQYGTERVRIGVQRIKNRKRKCMNEGNNSNKVPKLNQSPIIIRFTTKQQLQQESIDYTKLKKSIKNVNDLKTLLFRKPFPSSPFYNESTDIISALIRDESQPLGKIHEKNVNILESALVDLLIKILNTPDFQKVSILAVGIIKDNYQIKCLDEYSYNWLVNVINSLTNLWDGAHLKLIRSCNALPEISFSVKDINATPFEILKKLQTSNPKLVTNKWRLLNSSRCCSKNVLTLGVDQISLDELRRNSFSISYGGEIVRVSNTCDRNKTPNQNMNNRNIAIPKNIVTSMKEQGSTKSCPAPIVSNNGNIDPKNYLSLKRSITNVNELKLLLFGNPAPTSPFFYESTDIISVLVRDESQPLGRLSDNNVTIFEDRLLKVLMKTLGTPDFQEISLYAEGLIKENRNYRIRCLDEYSYYWLTKAIVSLINLWDGADLKLLRSYHKLPKIFLSVKGTDLTPFEVSTKLQMSNPLLKTNKWYFVHSHVRNGVQFLMFGIDQDSLEELLRKCFNLAYGDENVKCSRPIHIFQDIKDLLFGTPLPTSPFSEESRDLISVVIRDESQPLGRIYDKNVKILDDNLLELFVERFDTADSQNISIHIDGLKKFNYSIKCLNEYSYNWLITGVNSLNNLWNGADIKLHRLSDKPQKTTVSVKDTQLTPFEVTKKIQESNSLVNTNKWFLVHSHVRKERQFLVFGIDQESLNEIARQSFNVAYGNEKVFFSRPGDYNFIASESFYEWFRKARDMAVKETSKSTK